MSRGLLDTIASTIFPLTRELYFSCSTEPMMSRHFAYLLDLVRRHDLAFTEFTTNATLMTQRVIARILAAGIRSIVISIDGATKETFERIREGATFERVIRHVTWLQEAKRREDRVYPHVKFNWVLMRSNIEELPEYVELAHRLGVDTVGCVHLIANAKLNVSSELLNTEPELTNRYLDLARGRAARYGITFFSPPNFGSDCAGSPSKSTGARADLRPARCPCPTSEIVIFPDGRVSPCGYWWGGYFGNLTAQSFQSIWRGAEYQKLRESFETGRLLKPCQVCPSSGRGHVDNPEAFEVVYGKPGP